MTDTIPFSARNRHKSSYIDDEFPPTARIGLLHLLYHGTATKYLDDWPAIVSELQRVARLSPKPFKSSEIAAARAQAEEILLSLRWERVYDFCERIYSLLASEVGVFDTNDNYVVTVPKSEVRQFFATELQRLFHEENLAFEFRDGIVQRRGRRHTVALVSKADAILVDARLDSARRHFAKALRYFWDRVKPDPENAVKEAVCAVEAAAKELFPNAKAKTLADVTQWLAGAETGKLPKAIGQTILALYGFRSGGEGVAHGGATGGVATISIAEYALAISASQIILLVDIADGDGEVPF